MRSIGIILAALLFCSVSVANAQDKKEVIYTVKLDSASLDKQLRKIEGISFQIDTNYQIVTVTYLEDEKIVGKIDKVKKKVNAILVEYVTPEVEVKPPVQWNFDPEIDNFLNIENESIFTDKFMKNLFVEQIHPRSRDYYTLIKNIYDFSVLLTEVDVDRMPLVQRKDKLAEAKEIFDVANTANELFISALSKRQKEFFKQQAKKYERLYKELYE
jgi:hypothetical protein